MKWVKFKFKSVKEMLRFDEFSDKPFFVIQDGGLVRLVEIINYNFIFPCFNITPLPCAEGEIYVDDILFWAKADIDNNYQHQTNCAVSPGEIFLKFLKSKNPDFFSVTFACEVLGIKRDDLSDFLAGHKRIDEEFAEKLESLTSISKQFWLEKDSVYQQHLEQMRNKKEFEELYIDIFLKKYRS